MRLAELSRAQACDQQAKKQDGLFHGGKGSESGEIYLINEKCPLMVLPFSAVTVNQ